MKETALYPTVKSSLLECGCAVDKIPGATYSQGLPDFIATFMGFGVHLEVKLQKPKNSWQLTELQKEHLIRHHAAGAICGVLTYQIPEKVWRLGSAENTPEETQLTVLGHKNLPKMLNHWLVSERRKELGLA